MVSYNTKNWLQIFSLKHGDTLRRIAPLLALIGLYTAGIVYLINDHFKLTDEHEISNIGILHSIIGFAISLLLAFRINSAYDRWWEGRKLWGSLVNNSRNLALKVKAMLPENNEEHRFYASLIPMFCVELMHHLRSRRVQFELDEKLHPEIPNFDTTKHVPNQIAGVMMQRANQLMLEKKLLPEQLLVMNPELLSFMDICGACERIRNTPIPFSYSSFIKKVIAVYLLTLPLSFAFTLDYWAVPITMLVLYIMGSMELIAEEIEEPFGTDPNDLPLERLCTTINKTVVETLV